VVKPRVATVFGTRPEAIKMAPVVKILQASPDFDSTLVVTGQHRELLDQVLDHFGLDADVDLDVMTQGQTLTQITTRVMQGLESVLAELRPDMLLVHGDTATTFAATLAAFYGQVPVGHVEAGLRTYNNLSPYPEELMRRLTDVACELHFAPTEEARQNLLSEHTPETGIFVTGNTAIDALLATVTPDYTFETPELNELDFSGQRIVVVETHRRENWGEPIYNACAALRDAVRAFPELELVFSVHPNPVVSEAVYSTLDGVERVHLFEPFEYPEWANLMARASFIVTDSGGLQEEAPSLGRPVLLLRDTTERPEALQAGTVRMIGTDPEALFDSVRNLLRDPKEYVTMSQARNPYGDGRAAERILKALQYHFKLSRRRPADFAYKSQ